MASGKNSTWGKSVTAAKAVCIGWGRGTRSESPVPPLQKFLSTHCVCERACFSPMYSIPCHVRYAWPGRGTRGGSGISIKEMYSLCSEIFSPPPHTQASVDTGR
ncbi:hypothetical protein KIL84_022909 [Mauremys mutica]|uniref:Uncharacterized protein n=1 Tax=Mauremys mutica TaxID=74926 RepID=A0A9D3WQR3_9SAUR|nr:hypothetical protein KIL84_022909 [Mauremys mutica]